MKKSVFIIMLLVLFTGCTGNSDETPQTEQSDERVLVEVQQLLDEKLAVRAD